LIERLIAVEVKDSIKGALRVVRLPPGGEEQR